MLAPGRTVGPCIVDSVMEVVMAKSSRDAGDVDQIPMHSSTEVESKSRPKASTGVVTVMSEQGMHSSLPIFMNETLFTTSKLPDDP